MMNIQMSKAALNWPELDALIMYIKDNPKQFVRHLTQFGYPPKEAIKLKRNIILTLSTLALYELYNQLPKTKHP
jgi:hypothetical protein